MLAVEPLEGRALLTALPITINFKDLSGLAAPNKVYIGGWINAGQAVSSSIVQVATVQVGTGSPSSASGTPAAAAAPSITPNTGVYVLNRSQPAPLTIAGTGFGVVPSANTITFYEDAAGTRPSPVNPNGSAGPFYFSIAAGNDTSLVVNFTNNQSQQPNAGPLYAKVTNTWAYPLQADGTFAASPGPSVPFHDVATLAGGVSFNQTTNGNDRFVFVVSPTQPAATSSTAPWQNYPVTTLPANTSTVPPGPFGILEFGYDAQFNTSYVDSFGLNWSFVDDAAPGVVYGVKPTVTRQQMQTAYSTFTTNDPLGAPFKQLLWTSTTAPVPAVVEGQFTAIVSPKDWLTQANPPANLQNYWTDTVNAFFSPGNRLSIDFNGSTYAGVADASGNYTLTGGISIPKSLYAGTNVFSQLQTDNSPVAGQIKDNVFEAFSRGVALDGVWKAGRPGSPSAGYSSTAWTTVANWYKPGPTTYDTSINRTYDVYAKFFHYATSDGKDFRTVTGGEPMLGLNPAQSFAMAYGFSLDESPSVNTAGKGTWPATANVNGGTTINGGDSITVTFGPWTASGPIVTAIDTIPPQQGTVPTPTSAPSVTWTVAFNEAVSGVAASNFTLVPGGTLAGTSITSVAPQGGPTSQTWTVTANTGTGSGTLGLNLTSVGAIKDASGKSLTGGTYKGEVYSVRPTPAAPTASITIDGTNPSNAATVPFKVTFTDVVTGLTAANFATVTGGGVSGASVGTVTGSGTTYTVTANTGSGSGTLALRLLAPGTGIAPTPTGLPVTSAAYSIRPVGPVVAPVAQSNARADANPTALPQVAWTVTFSKPVGGLTKENFQLVSSGLNQPKLLQVSPVGGSPSATWTVTAATGSGVGTLRLDLENARGITDAVGLAPTGIPLNGQTYTVSRGGATNVDVPIAFMTTMGTATPLRWLMNPFTDADSTQLTVTLSASPGAAAGTFRAASGGGVTVAPSGTAAAELTFTGTVANLNAYFRNAAGLIRYTPAGSSLVPRTLTLSAQGSDGLSGFATAALLVRAAAAQNPAPTLNSTALLAGTVGQPLVITYAQLVAATGATQTTSRSVQFMLAGPPSGRLEVWSGGRWTAVPALANVPLLAPGGRIRWTPPVGASGTRPAFSVKAWDGWRMSGVSQVAANLAR